MRTLATFIEDKLEIINVLLPIILGVVIVMTMLPILWMSGAATMDLIVVASGTFAIAIPLSVSIYVLRRVV